MLRQPKVLIAIVVCWQLVATPVFADVDMEIAIDDEGTELERRVASEYYQDEIAAAKRAQPERAIRLRFGRLVFDRNNRKLFPGNTITIVVMFADHPYFCEKTGCKFAILEQKKNGRWREILDGRTIGAVSISHFGFEGDFTSDRHRPGLMVRQNCAVETYRWRYWRYRSQGRMKLKHCKPKAH